jgi:hypothetical protein
MPREIFDVPAGLTQDTGRAVLVFDFGRQIRLRPAAQPVRQSAQRQPPAQRLLGQRVGIEGLLRLAVRSDQLVDACFTGDRGDVGAEGPTQGELVRSRGVAPVQLPAAPVLAKFNCKAPADGKGV